MENTKRNDLTLYGAVFQPTGECWDFQRGEWVGSMCLKCFTTDPAVLGASWGKDDNEVIVKQYRVVAMDTHRSKNHVH